MPQSQWMQFPTGPLGWQPNSPQPSSSSDWIGDMRERLARLEATAQFAAERVQAHSARLQSGDERIQKLGARLATLEEFRHSSSTKLAKLEDLPDRLKSHEARMRSMKDLAQYLMAALLLGLALAGKLPMEKVLEIVAKAFGIG